MASSAAARSDRETERTFVRELAWQPVPSPAVTQAGPAASAPQAGKSPTATSSACTSTRSRAPRCSTPPGRWSCPGTSKQASTRSAYSPPTPAPTACPQASGGDAEREELEAIVAVGERAKDVFIRSNLRLVVAVARRYPNVTLPGDRLARLPGAKISLQEKPVIRRELESPRNKTGVFSTWKRHCGRSLPALGMVRIRARASWHRFDAQGRPIASFPPVGRLDPQAFGHRFILRR